MSAVTQWLAHDKAVKLTDAQKSDIINHIGCLCGMMQSVNEVLGDGVDNEIDMANLAYTASLLAELTSKLNRLLQTPPIVSS